MSDFPVYLSQRPLQSGEWSVSVTIGATTEELAVAAGRYYNDALLASQSLGAALQTALNTHSALGGNPFTVTYDLATGRFTIARTGVFAITWGATTRGTLVRDWLGFEGDLAAAASYTSDATAQGTIFADSSRSGYTGVQYNWPSAFTPHAHQGALGGLPYGWVVGVGPAAHFDPITGERLPWLSTEQCTASWSQELEPAEPQSSPSLASGARDDSEEIVPWVWHDFFRHHLQFYVGEPFRYYEHRNGAIDSFDREQDYKIVNTSDYAPMEGEPGVHAYWTIAIRVVDYVASE